MLAGHADPVIAAYTEMDIDETLNITEDVLKVIKKRCM